MNKKQLIVVCIGVIIFISFIRLVFAHEDSYYLALYKKASEAIQKGNEQDADFYLARYMGVSFLDKKTNKSISDLYPLFKKYKVSKPTAFISGKYSKDFIEWFIFSSHIMWGKQFDEDTEVNKESNSFCVAYNDNKEYYAAIIGSPYLEGWFVMNDKDQKIATLALIDYRKKPYIVIGRHKNGKEATLIERKVLDVEDHHIQHIWDPEFHDLDGDGKDELWVRYNKAWGDGFSQELAIYKIKDNKLELLKKFEGLAEGIAQRLNNGLIEVGKGFTSKEATGHLGYDQTHIQTFEYKNSKFIKVSEKDVPHILWSDEWEKYYFDEK